MTHQDFEKLRDEVPTNELIQKAKDVLSGLCNSGGQTFVMTVPPRLNDSDIVLADVIKRLDQFTQPQQGIRCDLAGDHNLDVMHLGCCTKCGGTHLCKTSPTPTQEISEEELEKMAQDDWRKSDLPLTVWEHTTIFKNGYKANPSHHVREEKNEGDDWDRSNYGQYKASKAKVEDVPMLIEDLENWYKQWRANNGRAEMGTVNVISMLRDFARQFSQAISKDVPVPMMPEMENIKKEFDDFTNQ